MWLSRNSFSWGISGQVPANDSITNLEKFRTLPNREVFLESAKNICFFPDHPKMQQINERMKNGFSNFLRNNLSIEDTLSNLENSINQILSE